MTGAIRVRQLEEALITGLRQQGAVEVEHVAGSVIVKLMAEEMLPQGLFPCVVINVSVLAEDMERAMA